MKTAQEIYAAMLEDVAERSGFRMDDSCDLAVRLYAAAAQIESLYAYADWSRKQCFLQTATGEYLDLHAEMHGVTREAAQYAQGILTLYLAQRLSFSVTVPEGTCFCVPGGPIYRLTEDCTIPSGVLQAGAQAVCTVAGIEGNAQAETICALVDAPTYVTMVTNEDAFTGGTEAESDEHLRLRIIEACRRKPNGANADYYEAVALAQPGITSAVALANYPTTGKVGLILSGDYGSPTDAQIAAVRAALADRTELGVSLAVIRPLLEEVDISLMVWPVDGVRGIDAVAAARAVIEQAFAAPMLRQDVCLARLGSLIYNTGLVKNYFFVLPTEDQPVSLVSLYVLGELTVTEGT